MGIQSLLKVNPSKYRKEFLAYCKENKKDNDAKREEAIRIWEEFKPVKVQAHNRYHEEYTDVKIDQTNSRSNHGVNNAMPSFKLKWFDLNLRNDLSLAIIITSICITLSLAIVDISLFATSTIELWLFLTLFAIGFIFTGLLMHWDTSKFRYIEKFDGHILELENKLKVTIKMFKSTCNRCKFKNGNIKWTVFEKEINQWYKDRVIHHMENPYEVEVKRQIVSSDRFITSGGVYAWWVNNQVVYIGKANNFKRRMKEHTAGLSEVGAHNERKYNVGLAPNNVEIQILAITNDEDEQSILESYYFEKYDNGRLLNSTGTLSWKKIMSREKYRVAWDRIKSKVKN